LDTSVRFADVLFSFDSFQIRSSERAKLEAIAAYLKSTPRVRLVLEGHCDERGSREYNMTLGEHRGLAARAYLIGLRVDSNRILTRSYGEEKPKALAHNEQAWSLNRRVEFAVYR
jgi:peptidoglycan-associated lipoprotein